MGFLSWFFFEIGADIFIFIKKDWPLFFNKNKNITLRSLFDLPASFIGKKMLEYQHFFTRKSSKSKDKASLDVDLSLGADEERVHSLSLQILLAFDKVDNTGFTLEELRLFRKLCVVLSVAVNYPEVYFLVPEFKAIILNCLNNVLMVFEKNEKKDYNIVSVINCLKKLIKLITETIL